VVFWRVWVWVCGSCVLEAPDAELASGLGWWAGGLVLLLLFASQPAERTYPVPVPATALAPHRRSTPPPPFPPTSCSGACRSKTTCENAKYRVCQRPTKGHFYSFYPSA